MRESAPVCTAWTGFSQPAPAESAIAGTTSENQRPIIRSVLRYGVPEGPIYGVHDTLMPDPTVVQDLSHGHDAVHAMIIAVVFAIFGGVMLIIIARRVNFPAIVLLLAGGVVMGPEVLGLFDPDSLGDSLRVIVGLAVGLILFEGGLTLDLTGYRSGSTIIKRLLSIGVLVTWSCTAFGLWLLYGVGENAMLSPSDCILAGSLVIVTGPTVIAPLLKRIKVNSRLHNILHWEGVLIDPIGVFIALLCFEWVVGPSGQQAVFDFALRVTAGLAIGLGGGFAIAGLARTKFIPQDMMNVFALAAAVGIYGAAEAVRSEAGLLSVTVAGFIVGISRPRGLKQIRRFKAEITDLLIGTLFILLAARLQFDQFEAFGIKGVLALVIVMLLVRPLGIALCTLGSGLTPREKVFLSWVAPRGIVAASMASLIQLRLSTGEADDPRFIETFTYSVIVATVVLQGMSAGWLAQVLGLRRAIPTGWLIVGSHALGRRVAAFIGRNPNVPTVLIDTNARGIRDAHNEGLTAIVGDARDITLSERLELQGIGHVLAITDNEDLNQLVCQRWAELVGRDKVFRCAATTGEVSEDPETEAGGRVVWQRLPRPSLLSAELLRHEASVIASTMPLESMRGKAVALASMIGDRVEIDPQEMVVSDGDQSVTTLYLRRDGDYLLRAVQPELVTTARARSMSQLFEEMVGMVVRAYPRLARDEIVAELLDRESNFPTALGHGVAVPHAYSHALDTRVCALAQVPDGIDFKAADGEPVKFVFLLLSPEGDPEGHLATLAEIARLVVVESIREELISAPTPISVLDVVRRACAAT